MNSYNIKYNYWGYWDLIFSNKKGQIIFETRNYYDENAISDIKTFIEEAKNDKGKIDLKKIKGSIKCGDIEFSDGIMTILLGEVEYGYGKQVPVNILITKNLINVFEEIYNLFKDEIINNYDIWFKKKDETIFLAIENHDSTYSYFIKNSEKEDYNHFRGKRISLEGNFGKKYKLMISDTNYSNDIKIKNDKVDLTFHYEKNLGYLKIRDGKSNKVYKLKISKKLDKFFKDLKNYYDK